jgi:hypothetical protein
MGDRISDDGVNVGDGVLTSVAESSFFTKALS